jgi:hypothetical protein
LITKKEEEENSGSKLAVNFFLSLYEAFPSSLGGH